MQSSIVRAARALSTVLLSLIAVACAHSVHASEATATQSAETRPRATTKFVPGDEWTQLSFGSYLAPKSRFYDDHGQFNVVFHFHGASGAHADWSDVPLNAVVVGADLGVGGMFYQRTMSDPERFESMVNEVTRSLRRATDRSNLRIGRIALVSFSAGYGATQEIVRHPRYGKHVDAVILLDGLHGAYEKPTVPPGSRAASYTQEPKRVSPQSLASFIDFARRAAKGEKMMVITHSSIVPPGYPSTEESTSVLVNAVRAKRIDEDTVGLRGMQQKARADVGEFHVIGFHGEGPAHHMDHLHLVGVIARLYLLPTWGSDAAL